MEILFHKQGLWQNSSDPQACSSNGDLCYALGSAFIQMSTARQVYINLNFGGFPVIQSQAQHQTNLATELLNTHPLQATTPYALKT
jgi:hypothetical protein